MSTQPYGSGPRDDARVVGRLAGIASIGAGMVHVAAAADHEEIPLMMAGFEVVAVLQVALGCLLFWRLPSRAVLAAGLAMMLTSIGLWAVSRTVGLGFIEGAHAEPVGFRDSVTVLFELVACVGFWELLAGAKRPAAPPGFPGSPVAVLGVLALALAVPAVLTGGHAHQGGHGAGAALVHAGGAGHGAAGSAGHDAPGRSHARAGGGHGGGHGGAHPSTGGGSAGHAGHAQLASTGAAHADHAAVPGAAAPHVHAGAPPAVHPGHTAGAAPGASHDAATGGGHTGPTHDPAPGGGADSPSHGGGHSPPAAPPPAEPAPEPTLTDVVANELDKLIPGRRR